MADSQLVRVVEDAVMGAGRKAGAGFLPQRDGGGRLAQLRGVRIPRQAAQGQCTQCDHPLHGGALTTLHFAVDVTGLKRRAQTLVKFGRAHEMCDCNRIRQCLAFPSQQGINSDIVENRLYERI